MARMEEKLTRATIISALAGMWDLHASPATYLLDKPPPTLQGDLLRLLIKTLPVEAFQVKTIIDSRDLLIAWAGDATMREQVRTIIGFQDAFPQIRTSTP